MAGFIDTVDQGGGEFKATVSDSSTGWKYDNFLGFMFVAICLQVEVAEAAGMADDDSRKIEEEEEKAGGALPPSPRPSLRHLFHI